MDEWPPRRVSPRWVRPLGVLVVGVGAFGFGLLAVGRGRLYRGDTWPDYLVMLAASALVLAAAVDWAGRDGDGVRSWRKLRGPSVLFCGMALIVLVVFSVIDPVESGVWPEGDSAQGFSMFTFLEFLVVAIAAGVYAPRGAGVTELATDALAGGEPAQKRVRIALRRFRLLSRESYLDVDGNGVTLVVPRIFGSQNHWSIPIEVIGVVLPDWGAALASDVLGGSGSGQWVTRRELRVPYLSTTSPQASPNLVLLFTAAQPLPPIRRFAGADLGLSWGDTRGQAGVTVDGVELRAVDPEAAKRALLARQARRITDPDAFIRQYREIVCDPAEVRGIVARRRRRALLLGCLSVATLGLFVAFKVTDDWRYGIGLVGILILSWLLERTRRSQAL